MEIRSTGKQCAFLAIHFEKDLPPRTMCLNSTEKELAQNLSSLSSLLFALVNILKHSSRHTFQREIHLPVNLAGIDIDLAEGMKVS